MIDINGHLINPSHVVSIGPLTWIAAKHDGPTSDDKKKFAITLCSGQVHASMHVSDAAARDFREKIVKLVDESNERCSKINRR